MRNLYRIPPLINRMCEETAIVYCEQPVIELKYCNNKYVYTGYHIDQEKCDFE